MRPTTALRRLLAEDEVIVAPGVYDGLSARLCARRGFRAVYATGGGIARSLGYPDLGLLGMTEVIEHLIPIVESAAAPVIADADTGYGNALNVHRTVRAFERIGVAAIHLEDQTFPKRCGHLDDKTVVSTAEMVQKLRAARDAVTDPDFIVDRAHRRARGGWWTPSTARTPTSRPGPRSSSSRRRRPGPDRGHRVRLPYPKLINMFQGGKTARADRRLREPGIASSSPSDSGAIQPEGSAPSSATVTAAALDRWRRS
jgi:hypothetical protein